MGNYLGAEVELAKELRSNCDPSGVETHLNISASLLQKLALVYVNKTPDKVALMQSVGLLNAALSRQPYNQEMKENLDGLCAHVVEVANVKQTNQSLIKIANEVMVKIREMRNSANAGLANLTHISYEPGTPNMTELERKKIKEVEVLQNQIYKQYVQILGFISKQCIKVLGSPPCEFALIGLDSLARKDITPYSDFKCVIALTEGIQASKNYLKVRKYFYWYATVFQIILLNLQETQVSKLSVPVLNNPLVKGANWFKDENTISGMSIDGLMAYAWKRVHWSTDEDAKETTDTESILPVSELVQALSNDEELKSGYHIADVTFHYCFVSGHRKVFSDFESAVQRMVTRGRSFSQYTSTLQEKLEQKMKSFNTNNPLLLSSAYTKIDTRMMLNEIIPYFAMTLGRVKLVDKCSSFEVIRTLCENKVVSDNDARELLYALAVSYEGRLKQSMDRDLQEGPKIVIRCGEKDIAIITKLVEYVGEYGIIRYMEIAFALVRTLVFDKYGQSKINLSENETCKHRLHILNLLYMYYHIIKEHKAQIEKVPSTSIDERVFWHVHMVISYYNHRMFSSALELLDFVISNFTEVVCQKYSVFSIKGKCLYRMTKFTEALLAFSKSNYQKAICESRVEKTDPMDQNLCDVLLFSGLCCLHIRQYQEGVNYFYKALTYLNYYDGNLIHKCDCKANIGNCYFGLGFTERARNRTNRALKIYREINAPTIRICNCHHTLGLCSMVDTRYKDALDHFTTDFHLRSRLVNNKSHSLHIQNTLTLIQMASAKLQEEKEKK